MDPNDLTARGGQVKRVTEEASRLLEAGCGVEVSDAGYGLRTVGMDRSNRASQQTYLKQVERRQR
jgi:hypothetical protein